MVLRLLDHGFDLVADDRVELDGGVARAPDALAGLLEVRGLGIVRLSYRDSVPVALVVELAGVEQLERLPEPATRLGFRSIRIDPSLASAPARVALALGCATGRVGLVAGALA